MKEQALPIPETEIPAAPCPPSLSAVDAANAATAALATPFDVATASADILSAQDQ
jgi:hypothetical protein